MWAVKGALVRGYNVRLLVRSKKKAEKVFAELFPPNPAELLSAVTLVEGSVTEQSKLAELFAGADVVLSFLGMAEPPGWAVLCYCPAYFSSRSCPPLCQANRPH